MTLLQDAYQLYDGENARLARKRAFQNTVVIELNENLAFLRAALREGVTGPAIVAQLDDAEYRKAVSEGFDLNTIQAVTLQAATYAGAREFAVYKGWDTDRLIQNVYTRIATLKKLVAADSKIDLTRRLQSLFKYVMVVVAHIAGIRLVRKAVRRRPGTT